MAIKKANIIKVLDKKALKKVRVDIEEALKVLNKYGLSVDVNTMRTDKVSCEVKFTMAVQSSDGKAQKASEVQFKRYAVMYGVKEDALGGQFKVQGKTYTITGLNPKARKNVILLEDEDGRKCHCGTDLLPAKFHL